MASTNFVFTDEHTLAEYVPLEDFKGLLQQRIGVPPDCAALLIRDGRLVQAFSGGHFSVGGIWRSLRDMIGGEHAVKLLVADLKPFSISGEIEGLSKNQVPLAAAVTVEFQLNPEKPENILGLVPSIGVLSHEDVYARLIPHLQDRVFDTVLKQVDAAEVRGNTALQDRVQADIMQEAERLFGDLGLLVRSASLSWALNDDEIAAMERRRRDRVQEMLDHEFTQKKHELERENEARTFTMHADLDHEKLKAASEDELRRMMLDQELGFIDARKTGQRKQELDELNHEIEKLNIARANAYRESLDDARNDVERAELRRDLTRIEAEIEEMQQLQRLKLQRLEEDQKLDIAERARKQQLDSMRGLNDVELDAEERRRRIHRDDRSADHQMEIERERLKAQSEIEKLKTQGSLTPDQLLAINAGASADVARIFAERARAEGMGAQEKQDLLREMVDRTDRQNADASADRRQDFDKAIDGMAQAASNTSAASDGAKSGGGAKSGTIECPDCNRTVSATDRYCRYCRRQLRA
jgi:hypothetical protein